MALVTALVGAFAFRGTKGTTGVLLLRATRCATVMFRVIDSSAEAVSAFGVVAFLVLRGRTISSATTGSKDVSALRFFTMPLACDMMRRGSLVLSVCLFCCRWARVIDCASRMVFVVRAGERLLTLLRLTSSYGRKGSSSGNVIVRVSMLVRCFVLRDVRALDSVDVPCVDSGYLRRVVARLVVRGEVELLVVVIFIICDGQLVDRCGDRQQPGAPA